MPDRDPLAPPLDELPAPSPGVRPGRRRRLRMGQAAGLAGRAGTPSPAKATVVSDLVERERAQKARTLLEGGRNKGEAKGYGATAVRPAKGPG